MERLNLHIVVDKSTNCVLFAEAGKDFVDFIIHILYLPLGAVSAILSETSNLGSVGSLLEGLKNLDPGYFRGNNHLLDVIKAPYRGRLISQLLPEASFSKPHKFYRCRNLSNSYVDTYVEEPCGTSRGCCDDVSVKGLLKDAVGCEGAYVSNYRLVMVMDDLTVRASVATGAISLLDELSVEDIGAIEKSEVSFGTKEGSLKDFVGSEEAYVNNNRLVMFMVMDDLTVRASVATGAISLLDELSVKDITSIKKREVSFGTKEAIKLLKASLSSKTVLTDVFLTGEAAVKAEK